MIKHIVTVHENVVPFARTGFDGDLNTFVIHHALVRKGQLRELK